MSPIDERIRQRRILEQTAPGAHKFNPQKEPSDPPEPPESSRPGKPHLFDTAAKKWLLVAACFSSALLLVNIGVTIASHADAAKLDEIKADVKEVKQSFQVERDKLIALTAQLQLNDVLAQLKRARERADRCDDRESEDRRQINAFTRTINGYNAVAAARGKPTPLPLQGRDRELPE